MSAHQKISAEEIASVVHDVRQMLAVITGRAGLLRRRTDDQVMSENLSAMEAAVIQANAILSRLRPELNEKPAAGCSISLVVSQSTALMTPGPGVPWRREIKQGQMEAGAWYFTGDISEECFTSVPQPVLLEVLNNLLINALGVIPHGGELSVQMQSVGQFWCLRLQDSGPGIPPGHRNKIFERGFSSSSAAGRGIGLPTCRDLLSRHGGELRLGPEGNGGACFELLLPQTEQHSGKSAEAVPIEAEPFRPTVLVVDDEQAVREMLQDVLVELGCRVKVARDAPGAAEIFPTESFEMVLIDQTLPGMSGLDFAKGLRKENPDLVLVLISGWGQEEILDKALESVVDLIGEKPITVEKIMEILNEAGVLRRQRLEGS